MRKDRSGSTDVATRYGGDQFGIPLIVNADNRHREEVPRRIREYLHRNRSASIDGKYRRCGFSQEGNTARQLLEIADRRLYQDQEILGSISRHFRQKIS